MEEIKMIKAKESILDKYLIKDEKANDLKYYKLTYLISATNFNLKKSFYVLASSQKSAKIKGKQKAFSLMSCNINNVLLRKIIIQSPPCDHSTKILNNYHYKKIS